MGHCSSWKWQREHCKASKKPLWKIDLHIFCGWGTLGHLLISTGRWLFSLRVDSPSGPHSSWPSSISQALKEAHPSLSSYIAKWGSGLLRPPAPPYCSSPKSTNTNNLLSAKCCAGLRSTPSCSRDGYTKLRQIEALKVMNPVRSKNKVHQSLSSSDQRRLHRGDIAEWALETWQYCQYWHICQYEEARTRVPGKEHKGRIKRMHLNKWRLIVKEITWPNLNLGLSLQQWFRDWKKWGWRLGN